MYYGSGYIGKGDFWKFRADLRRDLLCRIVADRVALATVDRVKLATIRRETALDREGGAILSDS